MRHLKSYSVFLGGKDSTAYGVLGLASPLAEVVPFMPCCTKTVLLPWGNRIIYDSLMAPCNITFGKGIRASLAQTYNDARERGAIVTALLPSLPAGRQEKQEAARFSNAKVLNAFRTYLYRSGLTPKVVEQDLATVSVFAEYLLDQPEPRSLREFDSSEVGGYVAQEQASAAIKEGRRRETRTSLKRFVRFLRDTARIDYHVAEDARKIL